MNELILLDEQHQDEFSAYDDGQVRSRACGGIWSSQSRWRADGSNGIKRRILDMEMSAEEV
jgi:hypothetical protein